MTAAHLGRHRLYWRIWLAILATVVLFALLAGAAWRLLGERPQPPNVTGFAELAGELLPRADAPLAEQQAALDHWRHRLGSDFALYSHDGTLVARTSEDLALWPRPEGEPDHHVPTPRGPAITLSLPDGRVLLVRRPGRPPPPGPILTFALIALGIGVGAYPVVRRLTRRLERLQSGVNEWGAGRLGTRVAIEGRDEVAQLAASFNDAAVRIEQLVNVHKTLLANASHELRSPLARIRLGVELMATDPSSTRRTELARDIGELDQLIDEILLASRLEGGVAPTHESVDFTAVAAEECARFEVPLQAVAVTIEGNARLLQRLVRNLLENAARYGGGRVEAVLSASDGVVTFEVLDRGSGIGAAERDRIFEPFYRAAGASEANGGVGLGLSLVRQIARQHGGDVECLPRDGGGSIFRAVFSRR